MKLTADRPFADPEKAALRLMQHAHAFEPIQDGRIYIEKLNGPFLFGDKGTPAEYRAGLDLAVARGSLLQESGTFEADAKRRRPVCLTSKIVARHHDDAPAQHFLKSRARKLKTEPTSTQPPSSIIL